MSDTKPKTAEKTADKGGDKGAEKVRLLKFGGLGCPACLAMDRAQILERVGETFGSQLTVRRYNVNDEDGESPKGSVFAEHYALSDEYEVEVLPTIIFEDAETGDELGRIEGGVSFRDLKKAVDEAFKEYESARAARARSVRAKATRAE